jgi:hypothetical protein
LYRAGPSVFFNDWITSLPASVRSAEGGIVAAEAEGGGNCSTSSIRGGFFDANILFAFLLACDIGGGGKLEELVSDVNQCLL